MNKRPTLSQQTSDEASNDFDRRVYSRRSRRYARHFVPTTENNQSFSHNNSYNSYSPLNKLLAMNHQKQQPLITYRSNSTHTFKSKQSCIISNKPGLMVIVYKAFLSLCFTYILSQFSNRQ